MKAQLQVDGQDHQQWQQQAANDPDYRLGEVAFDIWLDTPEGQKWLEIERAAEDAKFYAWLDTPEGIAWIDAEAESRIDQGQLFWNFDGFNPLTLLLDLPTFTTRKL